MDSSRDRDLRERFSEYETRMLDNLSVPSAYTLATEGNFNTGVIYPSDKKVIFVFKGLCINVR
jgi:hypothetical protein